MLYESNRVKHFHLKYGFLLMGVVFFIFSVYPFFIQEYQESATEFFLSSVFALAVSILSVMGFSKLKSNWRIVALNRMRIVIGTGRSEKEYTWLEVQSVKLNKFFGFYTLQLKNGEKILFAAYGYTSILTGDTSEMGTIIAKMKRDLSL